MIAFGIFGFCFWVLSYIHVLVCEFLCIFDLQALGGFEFLGCNCVFPQFSMRGLGLNLSIGLSEL
jgi:hypothetical protein